MLHVRANAEGTGFHLGYGILVILFFSMCFLVTLLVKFFILVYILSVSECVVGYKVKNRMWVCNLCYVGCNGVDLSRDPPCNSTRSALCALGDIYMYSP